MSLSYSSVQVVLIVMRVFQLVRIAPQDLLATQKDQMEMWLAVLDYIHLQEMQHVDLVLQDSSARMQMEH